MAINANTPSVTIAATTSSASGTIPNSTSTFISVLNPTTAICFVKTCFGLATATTTSMFVGAGQFLAVILSTGTGNIYVAPCGNPY